MNIERQLVNYHRDGTEFGSTLISSIHATGCYLTWTASTTLALGAKLVQPLRPGIHGQWSSSALEIVRRALIVFAMLLLLPLNLTLAPLGACLRALASQARRDFTFIQPDTKSFPSHTPQQVRISSFNTALMPEFIAARNGLRPTMERVYEVAKAIIAHNDDIVCIQEAFHAEAAHILATALRSNYPYIIYNVANRVFGLNSGLMIASKFPLSNPQFWLHPEVGGPEYHASKGVLATQVHLSTALKAFLFNTHLNGGADEIGPDGSMRTGKYFRSRQIEGIKINMKTYTKAHVDSTKILGTFCCGDFNIGPLESPQRKDPEWIEHYQFFRIDHNEYYADDAPPYTLNPKSTGTCFQTDDAITGWDHSLIAEWTLGSTCADHILVKQDPPPLLSASKPPVIIRDAMNGSSDHLALRATYYL